MTVQGISEKYILLACSWRMQCKMSSRTGTEAYHGGLLYLHHLFLAVDMHGECTTLAG